MSDTVTQGADFEPILNALSGTRYHQRVPVLLVCLAALTIGFVGSVPLAGPVSVMVVSRAGTGRFNEALKLAFGASVAEGIYAALAFWAFAALVPQSTTALTIARGVTAAVLLSVGIYFMRWKPNFDAPEKKHAGRGAFALGLTTSILNPTLLITWTAVTTALYSRFFTNPRVSSAIPFGAAAGGGVALWNVVLVALMQRFQQLSREKVLTWIVRVMSLVLILMAIWAAMDLALRS